MWATRLRFDWLGRVLCLGAIVVSVVACRAVPVPPTSPPPPVERADDLLACAGEALDGGDLDMAISLLTEAIALGPTPLAHHMLGNAYYRQQRLSDAEAQYLAALELDADLVDARSNLGVVWYEQGRLEEAEGAFRQALALQPNDADLRYNLGGVLVAREKLHEAEAELLASRALDDSLPQTCLALGTLYYLQGRQTDAIEALTTYLAMSDDALWRGEAERLLDEMRGP
jgi:tetratricopeptide (TPR) repeat protein